MNAGSPVVNWLSSADLRRAIERQSSYETAARSPGSRAARVLSQPISARSAAESGANSRLLRGPRRRSVAA